jgi:hypothetical protein
MRLQVYQDFLNLIVKRKESKISSRPGPSRRMEK